MTDELMIFITGGTFDKVYNYITGELYFNDTHLPEMLDRGRCTTPYTVRTIMMIDSTEMTDEDRDLVTHNCVKCHQKRIIITHGTDTMVKTATRIAQDTDLADKTIVLTGAMIPYHFGMSSDGFFNLGSALAFAQTLPPGVYIAMNGRYFHWNNVFKNRQTGYFEELPTVTQ